MATLNISLPVNLREWIGSRVGTGDYTSVSDYMRELVRLDQRRQMAVEEKLLEGRNSGRPEEVNEAFWEKRKAGVRRKANKA